MTRGERRKFEDLKLGVTAKRVKKHYSAKENSYYKAKQARERMVKRELSVARTGEAKHTLSAEAHKGVDQTVVHKQKLDNECTPCGMKNHTWKYSRKPVQVSA